MQALCRHILLMSVFVDVDAIRFIKLHNHVLFMMFLVLFGMIVSFSVMS